jgi:predicted nucleic acid-binding Zn ribbon protein
MPALPNRQHRIQQNARELAAADAKRYEVHLCPVCGRRRRFARADVKREAGCSTECNEVLLLERKRKERRMKALRFMEWRKMMTDVES